VTGLAILASPQPVDISIRSSLSTDDILGRLARAIGDYYRTDVQSPRYLGLGGSVAAGWVKLTVRPYLSPGEPQTRGMVPLVMVGQVVPTADGGEIRGQVTAPVGPAERRVFALVMLLWLIVGISGGPPRESSP
jgi:hypothetical protein